MRKFLVALLVAAAVSPGLAQAGPGGDQLGAVSWNRAALREFRATGIGMVAGWARTDGAYFQGELQTAGICLWSEVSRVRSGVKTVVSEQGRREHGFPGFRFDPLAWEASASGRLASVVTIETYRKTVSGWKFVGTKVVRRSTITVNIKWLGTGTPNPSVVAQPWIGYSIPPVGVAAGVAVQRAALVSGSIRFGGLGKTAGIPRGHSGSLVVWR